MNRWILRGLTVAGFAAGAWLLGSAAAYAHDASTGTTASGTVEVDLAVDLGTSTPPAVVNISNNVFAQAALTAKRLTGPVRSAPVAQARAALAATASASTPVAADAVLGACVDVVLGGTATGCGQTAGAADGSTVADATADPTDSTADPTGTTADPTGTTADPAASVADPMLGPGFGTTLESGAPESGPATDSSGSTAATTDTGGLLVTTDTGGLDGSRASLTTAGGTLPTTGRDVWWLIGAGTVLLLFGGALRRRTA